MLSIIISVALVSAVTAGLAAALVLADRFVSDYGECDIVINDKEDEKLVVQGGNSLLESLIQNRIFIPSACGGRGTCAYCKVKVLEGGGPVMPTEEPYLEKDEVSEGVRLSCQVKVRESMRIAVPEDLLSIQEYVSVCERIVDLTHDIKEFRFKLQDPPEIDYVPGQYVQLLSPAYDGNEEVYRAYSVSSDPSDKNAIELVIRLVPGGICTTYCFEHLKEGKEARFNGPYGEFRLSGTDAPCIFVAGGSGMAPIKCVLHQMKNEGIDRPAIYFFGANRVEELFYMDEMKQFERDLPNFRFVPVVARPGESPGWDGETGLVTEALGRQVKDVTGYEAYLCGSPGMIDATIKVLTERGLPEGKIFYDKFA